MAAISAVRRWGRLPWAPNRRDQGEAPPLRMLGNILLTASLLAGLAIYAIIVYAMTSHGLPIVLAVVVALVPAFIITILLVAIVLGGLALVSYWLSDRSGGQAG